LVHFFWRSKRNELGRRAETRPAHQAIPSRQAQKT
jgi:hypothetical protein